MKKVLAAICLWVGFAWALDGPDLVGRWRSVQTSKGGIGAMYDFFEDGTANFSPGAIVPMQYRLDGDLLTTYPVDGPPFTLAWKDNDHLRMGVSGGGEDYVRLGSTPNAGNKLVGEWTGSRDMDGNIVGVHWIFNADSSALFMIRFTTVQGRYKLREGLLSATFGARNGLNGSLSVADGTLSIDRGNGKVTRLKRY